MTSEKHTRLILAAISTTAVFGIAYGVSAATSVKSNDDIYASYLAMVQNGRTELTGYDLEGNKLESQGIRSVVVAQIESEDKAIVIEKGGFAKLAVFVSHAATPEGYDSLTLVMPGNTMGSYIVEKDAVSKHSDEELEEIMEGKIDAPGVHNTNNLVVYTPRSIVLKANETKQVEMLIEIPQTWPASLTGKPLNISFNFELVERKSSIGTVDDAINMVVVDHKE